MPTTEVAAAAPAPSASQVLSPEAQALLLTCAPSPASDEELRARLTGPIRWPVLLQLAVRERATVALARRISTLGVRPADERVEAALRSHGMIASFRQQYLERALRTALEAISDAGHETMLLKGAALALTVYDAFDERPMGDVDLLLGEAEARAAYALLRGRGWRPECPPEQERFYEQHHHLPPLQDPDYDDAVIELHTHIVHDGSPFDISVAALWEHSRVVHVGRAAVRVPSVEHALLHVCIHFAWSHQICKGAWRTFRDLHALNGRETIDWDGFCSVARRTRAATCGYWTLRLAAGHAALPVPAEVLHALRPPGPELLLRRLDNHFAANLLPGDRACPSVKLHRWLWAAGIRPARSGHGRARPWDEPLRDPHSTPHGPSRALVSHARRFRAWRRYLGALLG